MYVSDIRIWLQFCS